MTKLKSMLGLARRAGELQYGFDAVRRSIDSGHARFVIVAKNSSPRTRTNIERLCKQAVIPMHVVLTIEQLSQAIGRDNVAVVATSDKSISKRIGELLSHT